MSDCTVYSPCGRYMVRLASDVEQQLLHLTVTENALKSIKVDASAAEDSSCVKRLVAAATEPLTSSSTLHSLRLVASLTETDVLTLTTSAGVRKSFSKFAQMLYDALIGRSPCVRFFVETVAEMKERIQHDVQRQSPPSGSARNAEARPSNRRCAGDLDIGSAALLSLTMTGNDATANGDKGRVRTAIGDTVIELDEDIASEVLEQRFLTLDYDVDFTRAIFPIPLHTGASEGTPAEGISCAASTRINTASASPANLAEATLEPFVVNSSLSAAALEADVLRSDLLRARSRVAQLESENAKLRRENEALVQLSRHKMHEMQRLCDDFQKQVQLAADAEKLRARNKELRVQLQEALESQRTARRTLERGHSQRRFSQPTSSAASSVGSAHWRASDHRRRENPYLRSLSREPDDGYVGISSRPPYSRQRSAGSAASRASSTRRGHALMSPSAPPVVLRRGHTQGMPSSSSTNRRHSTRFDTPPPSSNPTASTAAAYPRRRSHGHRSDGSSSARGRDGDSPAPYGRTGGREEKVRKPQCRGGSGSVSYGSRASSTHSLPRRGPSLLAESSAHASPCGSVASSQCSSASHERLYRAATASSRMHQTKTHPLDGATAPRRAVFH
ncbi:hypothetical protein, conserved [Leishmania tarentolae]|uniref:Uncharacterized protein n=1 Tax=Leishmania tarentolae TaxID=5689 RepID=A0A640KYS6_LEITA|nr:hypothetical protein, conserved [Leishmania tarentolae]